MRPKIIASCHTEGMGVVHNNAPEAAFRVILASLFSAQSCTSALYYLLVAQIFISNHELKLIHGPYISS